MRSTSLITLIVSALTLPATLIGQGDERAERWMQNCRNNWNNDRANFCELRNYTLRPQSKLSVDGRMNGGVSFHGWDRNEVKVVAMIQASGNDDNQAASLAKQITVSTDGGRIHADGPSTEDEVDGQ